MRVFIRVVQRLWSAALQSISMGLLTEGKPLSWAETKKHADHVRKVGVQQFLALYQRLKDRKGDTLKWGDEASDASLLFASSQNNFAICFLLD